MGTEASSRIERNLWISNGDATPPDPGLGVEERPAVGRTGCRANTNGIATASTTKPTDPADHVDQALDPAEPLAVDLADVEEQRHPAEVGDRDLAQPLLVEQRLGAHPDAGLVEGGGLVDDPLVGLRGAAEHQHGGLLGSHRVEQRPAVLVDVAGRLLGEVGHDGRRLLRVAGQLDGQLGLQLGRADDDDPVPLLERRPPPPGHGRHDVEPRHQQQRRAEDDEPGQQRVADEQLHQRDAERAGARRHERGRQPAAQRLGHLGQAEPVGGEAQQADVGERPGEAGRVGEVVVADELGVVLAQPQDDADHAGVHQGSSQPPHTQRLRQVRKAA